MKKEITPPSLIVAEKRVLACMNKRYISPHEISILFCNQALGSVNAQIDERSNDYREVLKVFQSMFKTLKYFRAIEEQQGDYILPVECRAEEDTNYKLTEKGTLHLTSLNISDSEVEAYTDGFPN